MTDIPLREYMQAQLDAVDKRLCQKISSQDRAVATALSSAKEAVQKAESAMDQRLMLLNESRKTISDLTATLLPRSEYLATHKELSARIEALERLSATAAGAQGVWIAVGTSGLAVLGVIVDIALHFGSRR